MFDFDAGKLMIIATVALVVIGPKDLPRVLRQLGQMVTRVKRMAGDFQNQFMDAMKEADIQELRNEVAKLKDSATLDVDFNPIHEIKGHVDEAMGSPVGSVAAMPGSTSETELLKLPAASDIEPVTSIGATGVGPAVEVAALPEPFHDVDSPMLQGGADGSAAVMEPEPSHALDPPGEALATPARKAVILRRRVGSRFETAGGKSPAWQRSRNILPARRETSDQ